MIQTEDLGKRFGDFWAVDGLTLNVRAGMVLALLGQNGAGKTTTVRMLTSVIAPTRGWARVAGYDVVTQAAQVRTSVGVLTEQHGLYARMTAGEYLDFFGQIYRIEPAACRERTRRFLGYFGLAGAAQQRIGEYSKGMRQKLALARALLHDPQVLLLDEPTSAMDPESARLVRDEIANLRSANRAIIVCTHNLVEAEELADEIAIIYRGRILRRGSLSELKASLLGPPEYEVRVAGEYPLRPLNIPPGVTLLERSPDGMRFRVDEPRVSNPALVRELLAHQVPVVSIQEVPRDLEQVYLKVMSTVPEHPRG
jgi:ABC-2 type transport system ATP-binding protein